MGVRIMNAHAGIIAHAGKDISLTGVKAYRSRGSELKIKAHAKDRNFHFSPGQGFIIESKRKNEEIIFEVIALSGTQGK